MANKKISIDFQSKGIKNILKEIDDLQIKAKEVVFTQELDDQISNLGESARNVKEALDAINEALDETNEKKRDNKTLSNMESKIQALDKGIRALSNALSTVSSSIDASANKIGTAIDKINKPDAFKGLLDQMSTINDAFATLLDNTKNFKDEIYSKGSMPLAKASDKLVGTEPRGKGRPKGPDYDSDAVISRLTQYREEAKAEVEEIEIKQGLSSKQYVDVVTDLAKSYNESLKQRNELANKIYDIEKQMSQMDKSSEAYAQLQEEKRELKISEVSLQKTLLKLGTAYDKYVNSTREYESNEYNGKIALLEETEMFKAISDLNINDFSAWDHYKTDWKNRSGEQLDDFKKIIKANIDDYRKRLLDSINKRKEQIKSTSQTQVDYEPSIAETVNDIFSNETKAMETRGRPKKDVQIGIEIKAGAKEEAVLQLQSIIDEINKTNPHIDINLNLVSDYIMKNRESLVSQLNEQLKKMPDGEAKAEVEKLIPKIDKTFKGDMKLNIATNIPELAKEVPEAVRVIQKEVAGVPIDLNLKVNEEDIRKQVEKMGKISIPIGEITLSKNLYKNIVNEAEKAAQEENKAQERQAELDIKKAQEEGKNAKALAVKAKKELAEASKAREESVGVTLNDTLAKFMSDVTKLPTVIRGIYEQIDKIPLEIEVHFNAEQIQEALNAIEGLTLKVDKIDASKAVLDKLKLDVKGTMEELIPIGKTLIVEIMRLCNMLSPFQTQLRTIASESANNESITQIPVSSDVSRYIRDGLTVLINLVGDIQNSLSNLKNLTITVDQTEIQPAKTEEPKTYEHQLTDIWEAIAAVVRAIHQLNKQLMPQLRIMGGNAPSSVNGNMNVSEMDEALKEINRKVATEETLQQLVELMSSSRVSNTRKTAQVVKDVADTGKLTRNSVNDNIKILLSSIDTNVSGIRELVDGVQTEDTDDGTDVFSETITKIDTTLDEIKVQVKAISESMPDATDDEQQDDVDHIGKIISSIEDLRDVISAKIDTLNVAIANIQTPTIDENDEHSVQAYIGALMRKLELVRKQLSGLGVQLTHIGETISTEQTLSAINGKLVGNIGPLQSTAQNGSGSKTSKTRTTDAATERRQMRKTISGMLNRQNARGESYYSDNYLAQLQAYDAQLARNGGNRRNIRTFLSQSVANVRGDLGQLQTISTEVNNLLSDLDLTNSMRTELQNIDNTIQTFQQAGEITTSELMQIKSDLSNVKSMKGSADYKLVQELRKASSKRGKFGLYYTDEVVSQLGLLRNNIIQNPNNQQYQTDARNFLDQLPVVGNTRSAGSKLQSYISKGEKLLSTGYLTRGTADQIENIVRQMRNLSNATNVSDRTIEDLVRQFKNLEAEANRAGKTLWGQVGQRLQDMNAKFFATFLSFNDIIRYGRNVISVITDLDTALTEMRKVSDESLESLKAYQKTTFDTASALGTTAVQLQQSTADWLRLGESMDEASKSAVAATTLFNVSEFENVNDATTALVAMSQAYKDLDKTEIIDVMNNIGNNYAIATDQLATALQSSASALMTQGNDLYEAAALVTAGNQVVQDANKVGTGLRTISLRIAGVKEGDDDIKEELAELGEEVDEWVVSTQAKKRQVIMDYTKTASNMGQGVDILDSNGNLKDTYTILLEIAKIYKEIQEEDKKYGTNRAQGLVEELAGKNRSNIAASILMNPELLEDVYNSAMDSAGSAAEENAKYLDSIVGKTQQLSNQWQQFQSNLLNSDDLKSFLEILTSILKVVNKFSKALPLVTASVISLSTAMANNRNNFAQFYSFNPQTNSLDGIFPKMGLGNLFGVRDRIDAKLQNIPYQGIQFNDQVQQIIREYDQARQSITTSVSDWMSSNYNFSQDVLDSANALIDSGVDNLDQYNEAVQTTQIATENATQEISASVSTMNAVTTAGITMLISLIFMGISKIQTYYRELEESARNAREQIKETQKEIRDNGRYIQEISKEYYLLSKEVDNLGNNISLSNVEFDRYNEISNEIASRFPELIQGWTDEGNAIINVKDNVTALNEAYEKHNRIKLAEAADEKNIEDISKDLLNFENQNYWEQLGSTITSFWVNKDHRKKTGYGMDYDFQKRFLENVINTSYDEIERLVKEESFHTSKAGRQIQEYFGQEYFKYIVGADGNYEVEIDPAVWNQIQSQARSEIEQMDSKLNEKLNSFREAIKVKFNFNLSYSDTQLDAEAQVMAEEVIDSLDRTFLNTLAKDTNKMNAFTEDLIDSLGGMDSDALMALYGFKSDDANYREIEEQLMKSWEVIYDNFQEQIANAATQEEKDNLSRILQGIWDSSGMADFVEKDDTFQNNLSNVIKNTLNSEDIKRLEDYTKDFSLKNMELWNDSVSATMNATQAIEAYEERLKHVESTYEDISALLSQNTLVDRDGFDERYDALQREYDRELELAKKAGAELDRTVYGNVDLNDRGVIEWDEENLKKYKNAIESWGGAIEDYADSLSTVDAMSEEFDGVEIAFTPMLQTPNGPEYLDSKTVHDYINSLIAQMPEGWTNEDLLKLDAKGLEVNGKQIKGLIAEIGDEAIRVGETMHYLGEDGSLNTLRKKMDDVKSSAMSWNDIRDDLVGLAQAGKLDETTLKEYEYFDLILKELGLTADEAEGRLQGMVDAINKIAVQNAVDDLANYRTEMNKLEDAYSKFKGGEFIDANTLSDLQDAFGDLDSYQEFEKAVMEGQTDLQQYFDNIATEYAKENVVLAQLNEKNKEAVKQNLVLAGITKESADASVEAALKKKKSIESEIRAEIEEMNTEIALNKGRKDLAVSTEDLDKLTAEEIVLLMNEANASGEAARQVALFTLKKELANGKSLRNPDDLDYLSELIIKCGIAADEIDRLKRLGEMSGTIEDAQAALDAFDARYSQSDLNKNSNLQAERNKLKGRIATANKAYDDYQAGVGSIEDRLKEGMEKVDYTVDLDFDYSGAVDSAEKAGSEAGESFKDALDKILAMYDAELDAGVISFQTYVDKSRGIIQQYYNDGKIKASEYYDYLASLYEKQVSEYDKVISAVQRKLKEQTDELEKQKEAIEESYNKQIEEIQAKIDALQDENDEIEKNIALQKEQYELARARNQRTKLMYSESRGFYYEADLKGIQDAQENVRKAQLDKTVSDLQKKITTLQDAMKKETDVIDEQIKKLNEYAEQWGEVSSKLQNAIEDQRAAEILGSDWEKQILDMRIDTLKNFTDQYVALQQAQKDAYLEARRAELNEGDVPSGTGSGVKKTGATPTITTDDPPKGKSGGEYSNPQATKAKVGKGYKYNGKTYATVTEAQAQKQADVKDAGAKAYNQKMQELQKTQRGMPSSVMQAQAEEARKKAEANANKKNITALFSGTESAKAGNALVGELGSEIVLDKKSGTASIVDEPTIMKMKGGEKIFNAEETEKILKPKYVPMKQFDPKKFKMLHAFANGTHSPMQSAIAAQAVGIANGLNKGWIPATATGGQTINQTFNVSLPNITDASKASDLFREFEQLQRKATQFFN